MAVPNYALNFTWKKVEPQYQNYDNTEPPPWHYEEMYYEENAHSAGDSLWQRDVGGTLVGPMRYKTGINYGVTDLALANPIKSPGKDDKDGNGQIKDTVRRVVIKGNYATAYLKWVGSYINTPWVYGSHHTQVKKYQGTDCADLTMGAWYYMGHPYVEYVDESATSLYTKAKEGTYTLVTDRAETVAEPQPGDIILLDYDFNPNNFDHATIWVESLDGNNTVDKDSDKDKCIFTNFTYGNVSTHYRVKKGDYGQFGVELVKAFAVVRLK